MITQLGKFTKKQSLNCALEMDKLDDVYNMPQ